MAVQPSEIIRQMLVEAELAVMPKPAWVNPALRPDDGIPQAFTSSMPDAPDTVMLIKTEQGLPFGRDMRTGKRNFHPGVKIQLRSADEQSGYAIMTQVVAYFESFTQPRTVRVDDTYCQVHSVYQTSDVIPIGEEAATRRQLFTLNLRMAFEDRQQVPVE